MHEFTFRANPLGGMRFELEAVAADDGRLLHSDRVDLASAVSRTRFARSLAKKIACNGEAPGEWQALVEQRLLETKQAADKVAVEEPDTPKDRIPENVSILGIDRDKAILLYSRDTRTLWSFTSLKYIDYPTFVAIAGPWARDHLDEHDMSNIRAEIAIRARTKQLSQKPMGQGIRRVSKSKLLIVDGNEACFFEPGDGSAPPVIQRIEEPLVEGRLLQLTPGSEWCPLKQVLDLAVAMTPEQAKDVWDRLLKALSTWRFKHPEDPTVIAAMIVATAVQATLDFRPHLWLFGSTNSGKTALLTMVKRLFRWALDIGDETSEAGLRQSIGHDVHPVTIDEFESSRHRRAVLKLLRVSLRGGKIIKGTVGHKPIEFSLHHTVWTASIECGLKRAADRNRWLCIELLRPETEGERGIALPEVDELRALGLEVVALGLRLANDLNERAERYGRFRYPAIDHRMTQVYGTPVAVWAAIQGAKDEEARDYLAAVMEGRDDVSVDVSHADEADLLDAILSATIRLSVDEGDGIGKARQVNRILTVGQILEGTRQQGEIDELEAHGVRRANDGKRRPGMFIDPTLVCRSLLKDTRWGDLRIRDILRRIPDARDSNRRLAGRQVNGLWIPLPDAAQDGGQND